MAGNVLVKPARSGARPSVDDEDLQQDRMMMQEARPHGPGDWPQQPMRGIDGRMYGPGYMADPAQGTDSSPAQRLYDDNWLDNVVKMTESGMLHPKVMEMLMPQIEAMQKSQEMRGKGPDRP